MASIAGEIYKIARKKGFTGPDTYDIDKAVGAVTEGITGTPSPTYGTIADALSDLYTVVGGGGGGGGDLGALQEVPVVWGTVPTVGATFEASAAPLSYVSVGDSKAVSARQDIGVGYVSPAYCPLIATGATVAVLLEDSEGTYSKAYLVTVNMNNGEITAAAEWSGTVTSQTSTITGYHDVLFTMPTLEEGTYLMLYAPMSGGGGGDEGGGEDVSV